MTVPLPHPRAVMPPSPAQRHGHTLRDWLELVAADIDPASTQPREHSTMCWCGERTWHQTATCDAHYVAPAAARKAVQA